MSEWIRVLKEYTLLRVQKKIRSKLIVGIEGRLSEEEICQLKKKQRTEFGGVGIRTVVVYFYFYLYKFFKNFWKE